jgi:hypothetical protein
MARPNDGDKINKALFPKGPPDKHQRQEVFELYKLMVKSSEDLVARRQLVNTFYVSINGALLTAIGLVFTSKLVDPYKSLAVAVLSITGVVLALSWHSRIQSFGQLNRGKFAVISRIEKTLPAAIFDAEWIALGEGRDPRRYKTFTSREIVPAWAFFGVYVVSGGAMLIRWWGIVASWWT